jgi:HlyD family secretion protein
MLIVAAILALGVGYYVPQTFSSKPALERDKVAADATRTDATAKPNAPASKGHWAASAAGRVEPVGGEVRIGTPMPGRIAEVMVAGGDKVVAGDPLLRLEDDELVGRVNAALAEATVRKRERDNAELSTGKGAQDRRSAEDQVASAERQLVQARDDFDRAYKARRSGQGGPDADVEKMRDGVNKAKDRLEQTRSTYRKAVAADGLPAPTRPEVALTAARADLSAADAALERTRIRAATSGTALQVTAKVGETVAPSPENVLVVLGDLSSLRVRTEIDERDIGKLRVGQAAVIRSDAFPGKDFDGRVASLGQALGPSRIGQRGPRKPTDVDMLEIMIDLTGQPSLLPGMRVDVYLKPDTTASAPQAN